MVTVPFQFFSPTDLLVYLLPNNTTLANDFTYALVYNVGYTVQQNFSTYEGTITLQTPATAGQVVTIIRQMPDERLNYYLNTAITADALNTDFESLVLMSQQDAAGGSVNSSVSTGVVLNPRYYNTCLIDQGIPANGTGGDIYLPVLPANSVWVKDPTNTFITTAVLNGGGGGGGGSNVIVQPGNGFTVNQIVRFNGTSYVLALADDAVDAEALGVVVSVTSTSTFVLGTSGYFTNLLPNFTPGTTYFLSDATPGLLSTEPVTVGSISKPLFVADSVSSGYFFNWRGKVIPQSTTWTIVATNTSMTTNQNYFANSASTMNLLLPATSNVGDSIHISNMGSGVFVITQGSGQQIRIGTKTSTSGSSGSVSCTATGDYITLYCNAANTSWIAGTPLGFFTLT